MSKVTRETNIDLVKEDDKKWNFVAQFLDNIKELLNSGLRFSDNFDARIVSATFTAANTDLSVSHSLGRVPTGYVVLSLSASMIVYTGASAWTSSTISLKASAAGTASLLLF